MTQHTPGPWKTTTDGRIFSESQTEWNRTLNAELPAFIAACGGNMANARLIVAAPEMVEALRSVTIWIEEYVLPAANNPQAVRRFIAHNRALLARLDA